MLTLYIDGNDSVQQKMIARAKETKIFDTFIRAAFPLITEGDIFPGNVCTAIAIGRSGEPTYVPMKWVQNVNSQRNCIVPCSWVVKDGDYIIQPRGQSISWLKAHYQIENGLPSFALCMAQQQEPLPCFLPEGCLRDWLTGNDDTWVENCPPLLVESI